MPKGRLVRIGKNIIWKKIANKIVILNNKNKDHYVLNETGILIWKHMTSGKSLNDTIEKISKEYSVNKEKTAKDIVRFLKDLEKEKIIFLE